MDTVRGTSSIAAPQHATRSRRARAPLSAALLVGLGWCAAGCGPPLLLSSKVVGVAEVQPPAAATVHPDAREAVRDAWATPAGPAPFVVVRFETSRDLQALADQRNVVYVLYKAYACRRSPDWRAELISGPVFRVESIGATQAYDIYLPIDLDTAIRPRVGSQAGVDLIGELRKAEQSGLCVFLGGAKPAGRGFASGVTRIPVTVLRGRLTVSE